MGKIMAIWVNVHTIQGLKKEVNFRYRQIASPDAKMLCIFKDRMEILKPFKKIILKKY